MDEHTETQLEDGNRSKDCNLEENALDVSEDDNYSDSEDGNWEDVEDDEQENASPSVNDRLRRIAIERRIVNRNVDEDELPHTVTVLQGNNGEKVYLIGTAHFSTESCDEVRKVIRDAQPDVVVIELCRSRTDIIHNDEKKLIELAGEIDSSRILQQIRSKGVLSGLMTFFLLHMSAHITKQLGMAPGSEFRAAYHEACRVPGCIILYGDRSVGITLQRAFAELPMWQRLKFAFHALKDLGPIKPEDIEKLKKKDLLEQALEEMMTEFPQLSEVFLAERDIYLAKSMQGACEVGARANDSLAPPVVVGVVGLGHAAGVAEHFNREITSEEMDKITEIPERSKSSKIVGIVTKLVLGAIATYGLYRISLLVKASGEWVFSNTCAGVGNVMDFFSNSGQKTIEPKEL